MSFEKQARQLNRLMNGAGEKAKRDMEPAKPVQATVCSVTADGVYVKTDGDETAKGPFEATVMPKAGDRVGLQRIGGTWTVAHDYDDPGANGTFVRAETGKVVEQVDEIRAGIGKFDEIYATQGAFSVIVSERATVREMTLAKLHADEIGARLVVATEGRYEHIVATSETVDEIRVDGQLVANTARIDHGELEAIDANVATFGQMGAKYALVDFANIRGADIGSAKLQEIFANSGWFDRVTITGDADITGQLKAVLIDGDTARFKNVYADALKLLGSDGLYRALNLVGLPDGTQQAMVDQYGEELEGGIHGSRIIAESVTADQVDVTSLIAAMLLTRSVQIGATGGVHIKSVGNRFSFLLPGVSYTDAQMEAAGTGPMDGEVAYITVVGNESLFYMNNAMILDDLRFGGGNWQWRALENNALILKWMGASS